MLMNMNFFLDFIEINDMNINIFMDIWIFLYLEEELRQRVCVVDGYDFSVGLKKVFIKLWYWVVIFYFCYF